MVRMPHWPVPLWYKPIDLGLERVTKLLAALGNPEKHIPPVIHVTGTNGKGSTVAFMKAILESAGYKVHCYTSPHLVKFNERIKLAGNEIDDNFLWEVLEETRIAAESINAKVTFFEGTTVAALLAFSRVPADVTLVEVGLGGRLDATNVFDQPLATVITTISLDHTDLLGDSLQKIAYEKAGIMKENIPCILSQQLPEVEEFYVKLSVMRSVPLIAYEYDFIIENKENNFYYVSKEHNIKLPILSLPGEHQFINASNAIATLLSLKSLLINEEHIVSGLTTAYWPGRLQLLTAGKLTKMLPVGWEIWLDGAHNDSGANALSLWLETKQDKEVFLLIGMTKGRNVENFLKYFIGKVKLVCGVLIENEQSSYNADYIANIAKKMDFDSYQSLSIESVLDFIKEKSRIPGYIVVCGSLYLVGEILDKNFIK
ncbi:Bifunctional protein folC [Rickettsiales bacterium Ac37b]|nr:Bifunctional protein folC [Rickettsiales bacterium Ac37b]